MNDQPPPKKPRELTFACRVTCECAEDRSRWTVFVPEHLLWSPEGLATLFRICQEWLADPNDYQESSDFLNISDRWDSFHIVSIEQVDGFVPDIPDELKAARA